ncbi:glycoside hydrolase family 16 protein [Flavobacteriaceae bacterium TP-CH-4]|uniref:Glycoside hydrolase family 16 protein n=1 Tax=Pelagihabitans pacificus TaxID=2696054 RepID=A0A967AP29_9FLAO|nr:glycoside hydrolase family 16 protein [Pelagihabitans pacificus]NHF57861.1 glycoside hydrolase family 16 protein [Pelagihabitans pacificus]
MTKRVLTYKRIITGVLLFLYLAFTGTICPQDDSDSFGERPRDSAFNTLVWSDEFDGAGPIDSEKWFHQTQLPPGGSWWGGLIQHYTDREDNSHLRKGYLNLVAKKELFEDQGEIKQYTSARLNSKFAFTYGRVEIKAKLPEGIGTWPAIWLLSKNINEDGAYWDNQGFGTVNWPTCGEIDILEHWGKNQDYVSSAVHNASSYGHEVINLGGQNILDASNKFHIYTLEWSEEEMVFSVDGVTHFKYEPSDKNSDTWPYDSDYYVILNIAIEPDIDPGFIESTMEIDYIRIYQ